MKQYFTQKNRYWTCRLLSHLALMAVLGMTGLFMSCQNNHMNKPNTSTGTANQGSSQPTPPPPIEKHTVTFSVEDKDKAKGMLTAKVGSETINPSTPTPVEEGAKIIFTAQPNSDFMVDTWTVSGSTFENDSKTKTGSNTVTVTVQKENITITVSFKSIYVPVPYAKLDTYLSTASKDEINYIELMGTIPTGDFKGSNRKAGALGQKIKAHPDKKLALKLPETVQGLTDMSNCFYQCTNLISLLNVPQSVTTMKNSFYDCTNLATAPVLPESTQNLEFCFGRCSSLTEAPVIPVNVINLSYCFEQCKKLQSVTLTCKCPATEPARENAFLLCTALHTGSIKVPDTQLETYKNDAQYMGAQESWFVADTK